MLVLLSLMFLLVVGHAIVTGSQALVVGGSWGQIQLNASLLATAVLLAIPLLHYFPRR